MATVDIKTPEGRTERAKIAADARWSQRIDWESATIDECKTKLADLRAEAERGGLILQRRLATDIVSKTNCFNPSCNREIDITSGRFAGSKSRQNPETGLLETAYACSARCFLYLGANFAQSRMVRDIQSEQPEPQVVNEPSKPLVL